MIGKHLISIVMRALILNMTGILICSMVMSVLPPDLHSIKNAGLDICLDIPSPETPSASR